MTMPLDCTPPPREPWMPPSLGFIQSVDVSVNRTWEFKWAHSFKINVANFGRRLTWIIGDPNTEVKDAIRKEALDGVKHIAKKHAADISDFTTGIVNLRLVDILWNTISFVPDGIDINIQKQLAKVEA